MKKLVMLLLNIFSKGNAKKETEADSIEWPEEIDPPTIDEPYIEKLKEEMDNPSELITMKQLTFIMPKADPLDLEFYLDSLNYVLPKYEINTPLRLAHFISQIAHESGNFRYTKENLNYSASALRAVFGKYFTSDEMAEEYARKPRNIANITYANRMGNGDTKSNEGWKYRGRGLIQLTGKDNYKRAGEHLNIDLEKNPDLAISDPDVSIAIACWYWDSNRINRFADDDDVIMVTKAINGGDNGLAHRRELTEKAKQAFNV